MIQLIKWLLFGHTHKWTNLDDADYYQTDHRGNRVRTGSVYIQQCEKCGKVQRRTLS